MKLSCKLCGIQVNSLRPGDKASASVIDQLMFHVAQHHKQDGADLAAVIASASGYLAARLYATIPDEEIELLGILGETERELFRITRPMEKPRGGQGGAN